MFHEFVSGVLRITVSQRSITVYQGRYTGVSGVLEGYFMKDPETAGHRLRQPEIARDSTR